MAARKPVGSKELPEVSTKEIPAIYSPKEDKE